MSDQQPCEDTSNATTLSSSHVNQTPEQGESVKNDKKRQKRRLETGNAGEGIPARYQPYDLKSLIFTPIGSEQEVDVWHATPEQFHAYVSQFSHGFGNVNIALWPLAERLAFVNQASRHFQQIGRPFPFTERQHLVPDVDIPDVPDVDAVGE